MVCCWKVTGGAGFLEMWHHNNGNKNDTQKACFPSNSASCRLKKKQEIWKKNPNRFFGLLLLQYLKEASSSEGVPEASSLTEFRSEYLFLVSLPCLSLYLCPETRELFGASIQGVPPIRGETSGKSHGSNGRKMIEG